MNNLQLLWVMLALTCTMLVGMIIEVVKADTSYIKEVGNPVSPIININKSLCPYQEEHATEFNPFFINGSINVWFRSCMGKESYLLYANSSDAYNFSEPIRLKLNGSEENFRGFSMPRIKVMDNYYLMSVIKVIDFEHLDMYIVNSTDGLNWDYQCGNRPSIVGIHYNSELFNYSDGRWGLLLSTGKGGQFDIDYYESNDICGVWNKKSRIFENAESTWTKKINDSYYIYFSESYQNVWVISLALAKSPYEIINVKHAVLFPHQDWENTLKINTVPSIVEVEGQGFDHHYYLYYDGDQNNTGIAFDSENRYFDEVHQDINWSVYEKPISMSRSYSSGGGGGSGSQKKKEKYITINIQVAKG